MISRDIIISIRPISIFYFDDNKRIKQKIKLTQIWQAF